MYQKGGGDGAVLYRTEVYGRTRWIVGDSSALETCGNTYGSYLYSAYSYQAGSGLPTAPAYSTGDNPAGGTGWMDYDASPYAACTSGCGIAIAAGGH